MIHPFPKPRRSRRKPRRSAVKRVNPKRKASEFKRCYGSKARVGFVKSLECSACHVIGYSQNAHVCGNGGMGRKADASTIAPLCGTYPDAEHGGVWLGCHHMFDRYRGWFDTQFPEFDPIKAAADCEQAWQQFKEKE